MGATHSKYPQRIGVLLDGPNAVTQLAIATTVGANRFGLTNSPTSVRAEHQIDEPLSRFGVHARRNNVMRRASEFETTGRNGNHGAVVVAWPHCSNRSVGCALTAI